MEGRDGHGTMDDKDGLGYATASIKVSGRRIRALQYAVVGGKLCLEPPCLNPAHGTGI